MSNSYLIVNNNKYYVLFEVCFCETQLLDSRMLNSVKVEMQTDTTEFLKNNYYILLKYIEIFDIIRYNKI